MAFERLKILKESEKSSVYLAFDTENRCVMVHKRLHGELTVYDRLLSLPHRYLPKLYEVRHENGETVVCEEYIQGESIAATCATERQLRIWLFELCEVLQWLHGHGIVHRDVKPSNLLIGADGHIRLIDFDAAREPKDEAERDTRLLGTKGYAPPEQYGFSQTDARTDIYALGVTFQELLGSAAAKRRWHPILNRCTALEPKRRYQHVWQIPWAIRGQLLLQRFVIPAAATVAALYLGFALWAYTSDSGVRQAVDIVLQSRRAAVFDTVDMDAINASEADLTLYHGSADEAYYRLNAEYPALAFISTGYKNESGALLFGGFSTLDEIENGRRWYQQFAGLYTADGEHIAPEDCAAYAPAVLRLYRLDVFDTPLL